MIVQGKLSQKNTQHRKRNSWFMLLSAPVLFGSNIKFNLFFQFNFWKHRVLTHRLNCFIRWFITAILYTTENQLFYSRTANRCGVCVCVCVCVCVSVCVCVYVHSPWSLYLSRRIGMSGNRLSMLFWKLFKSLYFY